MIYYYHHMIVAGLVAEEGGDGSCESLQTALVPTEGQPSLLLPQQGGRNSKGLHRLLRSHNGKYPWMLPLPLVKEGHSLLSTVVVVILV